MNFHLFYFPRSRLDSGVSLCRSKLGWFSSYPDSFPSLLGAVALLVVAFGPASLARWSEGVVDCLKVRSNPCVSFSDADQCFSVIGMHLTIKPDLTKIT